MRRLAIALAALLLLACTTLPASAGTRQDRPWVVFLTAPCASHFFCPYFLEACGAPA